LVYFAVVCRLQKFLFAEPLKHPSQSDANFKRVKVNFLGACQKACHSLEFFNNCYVSLLPPSSTINQLCLWFCNKQEVSWVYLAMIGNFQHEQEIMAIAKSARAARNRKVVESLPLETGMTHWQIFVRNEHWSNVPATTALGQRHAEALHSGRKIDIYEKHRQILEWRDKKVKWRCTSLKKSIQILPVASGNTTGLHEKEICFILKNILQNVVYTTLCITSASGRPQIILVSVLPGDESLVYGKYWM